MDKNDTIHAMIQALRDQGSVVADTANGKRFYIITSELLRMEQRGLLLVYEGSGSFFYEFGQPLNEFRLVSHGFSLRVARLLVSVVSSLLNLVGTPQVGLIGTTESHVGEPKGQ